MRSDREIPFKAPLRAEVYKKKLTGIEQAVLLAMLEIGDSSGEVLNISIARIAAYSKFDEKSVQRAIWGDHRKHPDQPRPERKKGEPDKECPFCQDCLINRRVLQPLAPANWKKHRPAKYRLNLGILENCPEVGYYVDQQNLNFTPACPPSVPRSLGSQRPTVASPSDPRSLAQRPTVASPSVPRSHDSKAFDSRPMIQDQNQPQPVFLNSQILKCETCGGAGLIHQSSHLPGARLIPCPECNRGGVS